MKRTILLVGALSAVVASACRTNGYRDDRYAEQPAGTGMTAQRDYDEKFDSQAGKPSTTFPKSSSAGDPAPQTAGTAGTAQRDYDDREDSHETVTAVGTSTTAATSGSGTAVSKGYGGSTGPGTQPNTAKSTNAAKSKVVVDDRIESQIDVTVREMDSTGLKGGVGVAEASAPRRDEIDASTAISAWPAASQQAARAIITKYGPPDEIGNAWLCWKETGPWKMTMVHRQEVEHNFPMPHKDVLTQAVDMKVPADKIDDLAQFDGSIAVQRTAGCVSVTCDKEEMNFVALNLANDIITGKRSVEQAREMLANTAQQVQNGQLPDIAQGLTFSVAKGNTADPDARFAADETKKASGVTDMKAPSTAPKDVPKKDSKVDGVDKSIDRPHPNKPDVDPVPDDEPDPNHDDDLDDPNR